MSYASPVWNPAIQVDINLLEKVQRNFTKCLSGLKDMSYDKHLKFLLTNSLKCTRKLTDLVLMYNCIHGLIHTTPKQIGLQLCAGSSRSAGLKLIPGRVYHSAVKLSNLSVLES